ncbi:uncharacterized protein [Manis javanica]|uniref:uncharacterized protein n=1 Tax=Manis javanica TaxID=9974 RepID=UPI003C6CE41E
MAKRLYRGASYLGSLNDPKRQISSDASLSGACSASSRRRRSWRWCPAEATRGRGHIGCCRVSAGPGKPRRPWCGRGGGSSAAGLEGGAAGTRTGRTTQRRGRESATRRVRRRDRDPACSPMAAQPAPAALRRRSRAARAPSVTQQRAAWRRLGGGEPLPSLPRRSGPRPGAARRGRGGLGGAAKPGARGSGRGRGSRTAVAAARGGWDWAPRRGAQLMTSRPGCSSAGPRTSLRRFGGGRGLRPGLSTQSPPEGPPASTRASGCTRRAPVPGQLGFPPLQPLGRIAGDPGDRGDHGAGGKTVRSWREPPGGATHLPPPRAPPRGWGFGGCSWKTFNN